MHPRENLCDSPSSGVAPDDDVPELELRGEPLDVFDVVLNEVCAVSRPARIAVTAHVYRNHVIVLAEVGGKMVKRVRHAPDPVQQNQRRLRLSAPIEEVKAQAIYVDETVLRRLCESI